MDPLTLLQDYASRDGLDKVRLTEARVEFEDSYTFPRDTLTAYRGRQVSLVPFPSGWPRAWCAQQITCSHSYCLSLPS